MPRSVIDDLEAAIGTPVARDQETLDASSHDSWPLSTKLLRMGRHEHRADAVVRARDEEHIRSVLEFAGRTGTPVTVRGLGSSVTGQPLPVDGGIVLDVSALPQWFELDERNMTVTASASQHAGELEDALVALGWTMGNSPQSLYRSSLGGWVATMETGQFSSLYGGIEDLVVGYRVILATGEAIDLTASPRAAMGPDLRQLFIGSEGTLGVVTRVTVKVFPVPEARVFEAVALPSVAAGIELLRDVAAAGIRPLLIRLYDTSEARHALRDPAATSPVVFLGSQGPDDVARLELSRLVRLARDRGGVEIGPQAVTAWWERRFDFSTVESLLDTDGGFAETIEVAHLWSGIGPLYDDLVTALAPLADEVLGHFSHLYTQGTSLYVILLGRAQDDSAAVDRLREIWATAMRVCLEHGAELSHHHGGGLARSPYSRQSLGDAHVILQRLKAALDPQGILNPGKLGL